MIRVVMGTFIDRHRFPRHRAFYTEAWQYLQAAPPLVRPKRAGNWEPLKPISTLVPEQLFRGNLFFSAGRSCAGSAMAPPFASSRFYMLTLWFHLSANLTSSLPPCYEWLRGCWPFTYCYQGTLRPEWLTTNTALHQALNVGFVELDLPIPSEFRALLDHFEEGSV